MRMPQSFTIATVSLLMCIAGCAATRTDKTESRRLESGLYAIETDIRVRPGDRARSSPAYEAPGVYVTEVAAGSHLIEGVSTDTVAFLGVTERGPTTPTMVTSFAHYVRAFGGRLGPGKFLPDAVQGFFENSGRRCYVARIVNVTEAPAETAGLQNAGLDVRAIGPGEWGNRIAVKVDAGTSAGLRLRVHYWRAALPDPLFDAFDPLNDGRTPQPALSEEFDDLSPDPDSPDYFDRRVNHGNSRLVAVSGLAMSGIGLLTGGDDGGAVTVADFRGSDEPGHRTGLNALNEPAYQDAAVIAAPNTFAIDGLADMLKEHCEENRHCFVILDSEEGAANIDEIRPRDSLSSGYLAYYYPWIEVVDPTTGLMEQIPPSGHMAGIYARTDAAQGVWKAPANEIVRGAVGLAYDVSHDENGILNQRGVNAIRTFPWRGIRVWGARTLSTDAVWRYVNVRRLLIFLEASILRGTQWVVFEPNDEPLWAKVRLSVSNFLHALWRSGAFLGTTQEEAYFVRCDLTTMTQDDIDNGRLIMQIGVAPVRPAEFVIVPIELPVPGGPG